MLFASSSSSSSSSLSSVEPGLIERGGCQVARQSTRHVQPRPCLRVSRSSTMTSSARLPSLQRTQARAQGSSPRQRSATPDARPRRARRATTNAHRTANPRRSRSTRPTRRSLKPGPCYGPYAPTLLPYPGPQIELTLLPQARSSKSVHSTQYEHETSPPSTASSLSSRPTTQTMLLSYHPRRASTRSRVLTSSVSSRRTALPTFTPHSKASRPKFSMTINISATPSIWSGG